ncbi:MAG TPA: hypothetical protein VH371_00425 [Candidatus Limnocylindrales bacterium]
MLHPVERAIDAPHQVIRRLLHKHREALLLHEVDEVLPYAKLVRRFAPPRVAAKAVRERVALPDPEAELHERDAVVGAQSDPQNTQRPLNAATRAVGHLAQIGACHDYRRVATDFLGTHRCRGRFRYLAEADADRGR